MFLFVKMDFGRSGLGLRQLDLGVSIFETEAQPWSLQACPPKLQGPFGGGSFFIRKYSGPPKLCSDY